MNIKELTDKIIADGNLTKDEHQQLLDAVKEDGAIDAAENEQVTRVLNMVRDGQLNVE